jgi:hypothetical protein
MPKRFIKGHNMRGDHSHSRRGDDVGYQGLHKWIRAHKARTGICEHCGSKAKTEFANVSGEYKRDINDFIELCRKCHADYDESWGNASK